MSFLRGWCKKNLQPFQKAFFFFFFSREKGVESLQGFYGLLSPILLAPLFCVISFFYVSAGGQSLASRELGSPRVSTFSGGSH